MAIKRLDEEHFGPMVLGNPGITLVDFYADWCGPCRQLMPVIEKAVRDYPDVSFFKVDIDRNRSLAARYRIMGIPHLIVFKDGEAVAEARGVISADELGKLLTR